MGYIKHARSDTKFRGPSGRSKIFAPCWGLSLQDSGEGLLQEHKQATDRRSLAWRHGMHTSHGCGHSCVSRSLTGTFLTGSAPCSIPPELKR